MQPHSPKPVGIGLIGAGKHGVRYAQHIVEDIPQAELVSVCRTIRSAGEQLAATYGCHYHATYDQLIADQNVDGIAIVVPPALHGSIVAAACPGDAGGNAGHAGCIRATPRMGLLDTLPVVDAVGA